MTDIPEKNTKDEVIVSVCNVDDMEELQHERDVPKVIKEVDEPPDDLYMERKAKTELSPKDKMHLFMWNKNLNFIVIVIGIMCILYFIDIFISIKYPEANITLKEPLFELLKTILLMASGYVFAKSGDEINH